MPTRYRIHQTLGSLRGLRQEKGDRRLLLDLQRVLRIVAPERKVWTAAGGVLGARPLALQRQSLPA